MLYIGYIIIGLFIYFLLRIFLIKCSTAYKYNIDALDIFWCCMFAFIWPVTIIGFIVLCYVLGFYLKNY